ncbi:uncharacterized protein I303_104964 [Kwoniella dejecticola CBS 10117]|uniref:Rhodanese domain-containing protein n=1 Tax=Kwoniella dejecticola CBS 10117 TaxID=1296121 RepID=A0A1A6A3V2_9TREE|nr:uncharacterized protein I303_05591 [Kwoniella dejecticola CBS 10117]OBR84732.1 hypothetical protein I303_05591 [Kwoniella dejecticola CBS 10117]
MITKESKILVVGGAGTMGSSTALHLARRGYTDIRILDMFQPPSANSAGNDMNKLISTQYIDGIWGRLALETWDAWNNDHLFTPFLHAVGRLDLAQNDESRIASLKRQYDLNVKAGKSDNVEWLRNKDDILRKGVYLKEGDIEGWQGMYIRDAGWVAARDALTAVGAELRRLGVKSVFGSSGTFKSLLLAADGKTVRGVKAVDGREWPADLVIMATGAWSPTLIDLEDQCVSKCWQFGHIRLSAQEGAQLKDTPTLYNSELGFFMEPSPEGVMKFVNEFEGYTRMATCRPFGSEKDITMSVPRSHALNPADTIPEEGERAIRDVIKTCFPQFADKPLFDKAICWCTDSYDGNWLLCDDPRYKGLVLATGDCGHTFKMLPIVGKYVADLIEGKLCEEDRLRWRWRPESKKAADTGREGPQPEDLNVKKGWRHDDHAQDGAISALTGRIRAAKL